MRNASVCWRRGGGCETQQPLGGRPEGSGNRFFLGWAVTVGEENHAVPLTSARNGVYITFSGVRPEHCYSDVIMYAIRYDILAKRLPKTPCARTGAWLFVAVGGGRDMHVSDVCTGGGP